MEEISVEEISVEEQNKVNCKGQKENFQGLQGQYRSDGSEDPQKTEIMNIK